MIHVLRMEAKDRVGTLAMNNVGTMSYVTISAPFFFFFFPSVVVNKTTLKVSKQAFCGK